MNSSASPCLACGIELQVQENHYGHTVACPSCGAETLVRRPPPPNFASEVPGQAFAPNPAQEQPSSPDREPALNLGAIKSKFISQFSELPYRRMFSLPELSPRELFSKEARWILGFGLCPLAILYAVGVFGLTFGQSSWLIGGYFCLFWALVFNGIVRPQASLAGTGALYCVFTAFIGIPLLLFWQRLPVISSLYAGTESNYLLIRTFCYIVGVGLLEEFCKAMPLIFFALRKGIIIPKVGVYLGILSGLGFALAEVVQYSVNYWHQAAHISAEVLSEIAVNSQGWIGNLDHETFLSKLQEVIPQLGEVYGTMLLVQIVRFIPLPLLHAAWAGILGYFIAVASTDRKTRWHVILIGLVSVAILHGLYDVFVGTWIGFALALTSILIFTGYLTMSLKRNW